MKIRVLPRNSEELIRNDNSIPNGLALVTSLRFDPRLREITRHIPIALESSFNERFFLSNLHYQRLKYGARLLGWDVSNLSYESFCNALENIEQKILDAQNPPTLNGDIPQRLKAIERPYRIRMLYAPDGILQAEFKLASERSNLFSGLMDLPPVYDVVLDNQKMSADYSKQAVHLLKTSARTTYDDARRRHNINLGDLKEVLLVSHDGLLLEGSLTGVAVDVDGTWVTPPLSLGGMCSTVRSFLIELGYLKEGIIETKNISPEAKVLLFNGVVGVVQGKLNMST